MPYEIPKRVFTEIESAEYLGISPHYLRRARTGRSFPTEKQAPPPYRYINCQIRYLREDLDTWLDQFKERKEKNQAGDCT